MRAPIAYLLAGIANAATLAVLAVGPLRPAVYFTGTVFFLFTIGGCYALFTAVLLEFMGDSGKSGSARYAIINSLGNLPVAYMSWIDGRGYALLGSARHAGYRRGGERGCGVGVAGPFCGEQTIMIERQSMRRKPAHSSLRARGYLSVEAE